MVVPMWRIILFFLPLVVLSVSQSLTYPLVGSIVSHGPLGEQEYTAYVMGQQVLFFLGAIGGGLITTSMMFCRNRRGYANFLRMNQGIALAAAGLQALACLPPFNVWVFHDLLGLDGEMFRIARNSLFLCIPMQYCFFVRNPYIGTLFIEKRSGLTNYATVARILIAMGLSYLFPKLGWTGYRWGVVAMTIPVAIELLVTYCFAMPFLHRLPERPLDGSPPASPMRQLRYTIPLSFGGILLSASALVVSTFLSLSPHPAFFRPVHFFAVGISNPVAFSALKMQTVVVAFPPSKHGARRIFGFGLAAGAILGLVPLLFAHWPTLSHWYFCTYQSLPESSLWMARRTLTFAAILPIIFAIRGHAEGLAAVTYRTDIVMRGQIAYFLTILATLAACLHGFPAPACFHFLPIPGDLWGMLAIAMAATAAAIMIRASLYCEKKPHVD